MVAVLLVAESGERHAVDVHNSVTFGYLVTLANNFNLAPLEKSDSSTSARQSLPVHCGKNP